MTALRLGRLPHDPARLAAAPRHILAASAVVPPRLLRDHIPFAPGCYGNDVLPDCTAAGIVNAARAYSWTHVGADISVTDALVPAFYAACVGVPDTYPAMEATDGVMLQDALDRAATDGVAVGQQVPLIPYGATIALGDRAAMAHAMVTLGAVVLGVGLATADQQAVGGLWDINTPGDQTPDSWGGHCVILWAYAGLGDTDEVMIGTWGTWQRATWNWVDARTQEIWRLVWPQL